MNAKIISMNSIAIVPSSDEEQIIMDSWYGRKVIATPCINNAGFDAPARYISYTLEFTKETT